VVRLKKHNGESKAIQHIYKSEYDDMYFSFAPPGPPAEVGRSPFFSTSR
jgi:hypothetical protein